MVLQAKGSIIVVLVLCCLSVSCGKNKTGLPSVALDPEQVPMIHTDTVISLISDSGVTKLRLSAEIWDIFSTDKGDVWHFPKGILVEKFDSLFNVEARVEADTAYNYVREGLWRLIGNVKLTNLKQDKFETSELFWNQRTKKIYSDSLMRMEDVNGNIFKAVGFVTNQEMTYYRWGKTFQTEYVVPQGTDDGNVSDTLSNQTGQQGAR